MTLRTLRITSVEGLATLGRHLKFGGQAPFQLILALPGLPPDQRSGLEETLARLLSYCGCSEGAVGLMAALPLGAMGAIWLMPAGSGWVALAVTIGAAAIIGAMAGKAVGYFRARRRLATEVARIMAIISPTWAEHERLEKAA